jgi:Thioredoxin-like domain
VDRVLSLEQFDEGRAEITGDDAASVENINRLIEDHRMPLVVEFNSDTAPRIFRRAVRTHLLLFISKTASYFDKTVADFRKVAEKYRGQVYTVSYC